MNKFEKIVVLAGGDSTRFWPLTQKHFTPFVGIPFIYHLLSSLAPFGEKIIVVSHKDTMEKTLKVAEAAQKHLGLPIEVQEQKDDFVGMGGALATLEGQVGEALIVNASDLFESSYLHEFIKSIQKKNPSIMITIHKVSTYFPGGYVAFEEDQITNVIEKPEQDKVPSQYIKLVVDYIKDIGQFIKTIKSLSNGQQDVYEVAINEYIKQGESVKFQEYEGHWYFLKYPWHVLSVMEGFLKSVPSSIDESTQIADTAIIQGTVVIGKNVKVGNFSKIVGPSFIGDNSVIGDYTLIRNSQIGRNCVIGGASEVARSYIGDSVMLHRNYVGDSVLADNVLLGAQAVTANFRFDQQTVKSSVDKEKIDTKMNKFGAAIGEGAKIGVNSTILPGVKIGAFAQVHPGSTVAKDIHSDHFFKEGELRPNKI